MRIRVNGHREATFYRVKPLSGAAAYRAWELRTPTGKVYHVCLDIDGHLGCDCPDFIYVRSNVRGFCKHCAALTAAGLL